MPYVGKKEASDILFKSELLIFSYFTPCALLPGQILCMKHSSCYCKTSWYSIDVSGNDRHVLLFHKKCHFCHLLPFAKVGQHGGLIQHFQMKSALSPSTINVSTCMSMSKWCFYIKLSQQLSSPETKKQVPCHLSARPWIKISWHTYEMPAFQQFLISCPGCFNVHVYGELNWAQIQDADKLLLMMPRLHVLHCHDLWNL